MRAGQDQPLVHAGCLILSCSFHFFSPKQNGKRSNILSLLFNLCALVSFLLSVRVSTCFFRCHFAIGFLSSALPFVQRVSYLLPTNIQQRSEEGRRLVTQKLYQQIIIIMNPSEIKDVKMSSQNVRKYQAKISACFLSGCDLATAARMIASVLLMAGEQVGPRASRGGRAVTHRGCQGGNTPPASTRSIFVRLGANVNKNIHSIKWHLVL